jgi:hypothetical protein
VALQNLDRITRGRKVEITPPPQGATGRQRRPTIDSENARLRRAQKPVDVMARRHDDHGGGSVLAWPAFRDAPHGLLERAKHGDHGASARALELLKLGLAVEHARRRRAEP